MTVIDEASDIVIASKKIFMHVAFDQFFNMSSWVYKINSCTSEYYCEFCSVHIELEDKNQTLIGCRPA